MDIRGRAVLLEQYESGVRSVDKALKRVVRELSPSSMGKQEALYWWRRFQHMNFDISFGACTADCALLKNGTFLRTSQALFQLDSSARFYNFCNMSGLGDRFYIAYSNPSNFIVDTFYGIKRKVVFDCSAVLTNNIGGKVLERFKLSFLHFLTEDRVLGISDNTPFGLKVFCGTFKFKSCVLKIENLITLNGWLEAHYLMLDSTTQIPSIMWRFEGPSRMQYAPTNMNVNDYSLDATTINVPFPINFPIKLDDKIFGFNDNGMVNPEELIVISLTTLTTTVYDIKTDGLTLNSFTPDTPHTWNGKTLWIARHNCDTNTSNVIKFDLQTLKWQETIIEVKGLVKNLSLINNSLLLHSFIREDGKGNNGMSYRFSVGRCDSLSSAVWNSIRHYSQVHPEFNRWIASKLPSRLRNYSPLWD